jgi:membrane associated rhomboid family serine protease
MDPIWIGRFALVPELVLRGEYWRLITFLALPLSLSPIWIFFTLWFMYFVVTAIERYWGAFKTTFYVLVSIVWTILFSFAFNFPILQVKEFESTLFLAAAALYPEMEVQLFMVIRLK